MSASDELISSIKKALSELSEEEKNKLFMKILDSLGSSKTFSSSTEKPSEKKSYQGTTIPDKEKHEQVIREIDRILNKIDKSISEMDELRRKKAPLLQISQ